MRGERPPGLLTGVVGIDLVGLSEAAARRRLRDEIAAAVRGRAKPGSPPPFPPTPRRCRPSPGSPVRCRRCAPHWIDGSFGWEVVSRRLASRLSQRALSAASGVSLRWLVTLEQGQGRPSDDVCRKLAAGFLPDGSELVRAVLDLRLRRAAGESLVMWHRRRPPRVAVQRLYAEAAAVLDAEDATRQAEQEVTAAAFLEEFTAQWHGDAASTRPPVTPAQAWPGRWPRVRG